MHFNTSYQYALYHTVILFSNDEYNKSILIYSAIFKLKAVMISLLSLVGLFVILIKTLDFDRSK